MSTEIVCGRAALWLGWWHARLSYLALVYAVLLLFLTGLVEDGGRWYSPSNAHRDQVDALFKGRLALNTSPSALDHDFSWSGGGVQQVWGLGVPIWQLPFAALARLFGYRAFPERLALGAALFAAALFVLEVLLTHSFGHAPGDSGGFLAGGGRPSSRLDRIVEFGGVVLILVFPAFVNLLRSRMMVYEEVMAYVFLVGISLLGALLQFIQRPKPVTWTVLWTMAGLSPLVRPTLVFCALASVVVGSLFLLRAQLSSQRRVLRWPPNGAWVVGPCLFVASAIFLFATNFTRFGSGFEFGHRLNLQQPRDLTGSMYATRFGHPYEREPLLPATEELFGALFLEHRFNGSDWYRREIFPGQSATLRWREFYFRTFDISYCLLSLGGYAAGLALWISPRFSKDQASDSARRREILKYSALWSFLCVVPLATFYLRTPAIASRYMLDFAPGLAAAVLVGYQSLVQACRAAWRRGVLVLALVGWIAYEIQIGSCAYGGPTSMTYAEATPPQPLSFPGNPDIRAPPGPTVCRFDGKGWNGRTGAVMPLVVLFARSPQFLELDLEATDPQQAAGDLRQIRAKVGLQFLERESIAKTEAGWCVRFRPPGRLNYRVGLQVVFIVFVGDEHLADSAAPWRLKAVKWGLRPGEARFIQAIRGTPHD